MYEYACEKCGHSFEKLVKSMNSTDAIECPKCQSKKTARKLSVFAVAAQGLSKSSNAPQGCGRCGGPGPCAFE